jgi:hypothetical protein
MLREYKPLPSNPVQAVISPLNLFSTSTASSKKVGRPRQQLNPKTKQKRHKQQQRRKKMPSSQEGQTKFYACT